MVAAAIGAAARNRTHLFKYGRPFGLPMAAQSAGFTLENGDCQLSRADRRQNTSVTYRACKMAGGQHWVGSLTQEFLLWDESDLDAKH